MIQDVSSSICPLDGCPTPPPSPSVTWGEVRPWSEASGWTGGSVPADLENVEIE
eukprot:CAMPEP_0194541906 /NCGR_PEP_ID=MMETSP0253-20130528/83040_1 /TAXON_ID=2966 /ORGANISM="Noctiluca scintillans" /LENGTH=53 /DNA_ID=CAMNT_0039388463 /DNA_START=1 /DNA_END=159 /DNA_ORIENTATION=+